MVKSGASASINIKSDLDKLFGKKKKKQDSQPKADEQPTPKLAKAIKKKDKSIEKPVSAPKAKGSFKRTEDGLRIYSLDELNVGKGGDTEDCPFDCKCCF